jgi:hypothetical protein
MILVGGAAMAAPRYLIADFGLTVRLPVQTFADAGGDSQRSRIVSQAERRYNAKVIRVTEVTVDGHRMLELRLLSDQRIWMIRVDAETGQEMPGSR